MPFIFDGINDRLKYHIYQCHETSKFRRDDLNKDNDHFFVFPYINITSNRFKFLIKKYHFSMAHTIHNKLNCFIKRHKDALDKFSQNDIVYKISCGDCNATYVGHSKRQLKTRVEEHRSSVRRGCSKSVIFDHCSSHNHNFDWDGVEICDIEHSYKKRLISEMIFIKRQSFGINIQNDTDSLPTLYNHILNLLPPF